MYMYDFIAQCCNNDSEERLTNLTAQMNHNMSVLISRPLWRLTREGANINAWLFLFTQR